MLINEMGLRVWLKHPWLGVGPKAYSTYVFDRFDRELPGENKFDANHQINAKNENIWIELLAETGALFTLGFAIVVVRVLWVRQWAFANSLHLGSWLALVLYFAISGQVSQSGPVDDGIRGIRNLLLRARTRGRQRAGAVTRLVVDARLAGHSGIGVYLEHVLPPVIERLASWHPVILVRSASCARIASQVGTRGEVVAWDVPPLGLSNLWRAPPAVGPRDLLWTPHFNVPLFGSAALAVTLHDVLPLSAPQLAGLGRSVPVRLWFGAIRARARVVFCVSEFTRREAMARGGLGAARVLVTPLGVDRRWFDTEATAPHRRAEGDAAQPTIVFVGLFKPHKNLTRLLHAFDRVKAQIPHRLVLVARHERLRHVDREAMSLVRGLGDRVELVSDLPLAELVARVRSAQFLALPSLHEGFGLPALEAMAAGTPVLAARAGALPEVCGEAATYCDPLSVDDIARTLALLAGDPALRARLAAAGRARAAAFTWDRCAATTVEALEVELRRLRAEKAP